MNFSLSPSYFLKFVYASTNLLGSDLKVKLTEVLLIIFDVLGCRETNSP